MASGWQEVAAQQAEEVSARLRELLTTGLGLLRSELGLELGLQPQLYPSWVFLAVPAFLGILLLLLLLHCASSSRGKPSARPETTAATPLPAKTPAAKPAKPEEAKKKSKKKPQPDKAKPNGRPVELAEEEVVFTAVKKESPKQSVDADKKNEKVKKAKKKPKVDVKQTQQSPSQDKKEAEEGNWETKISNKEKRQQRKRDKGADSDVTETTTVVSESFTHVPSQSTNTRKNKGQSEISAINGSSWNEKPTKVIPSQVIVEKWVPPAAAAKKKNEPCSWTLDAVDTNGKDWSAPWSERSIFPGIAAVVSDPVPQADSQWEGAPEPTPDDEWSGLNGLSSTDPGSDWNAPAEEWGNYGEEEPVSAPQIEEPEPEVPKVSDDEKEKEETSGQTAAGSKTKKKKKKKKKQGEESGSPTQESEVTREAVNNFKNDPTPAPAPVVIPPVVGKMNEFKEAVKETRTHAVFTESSVSDKSSPVVQQPQESSSATAKQNSVPPIQSQAKTEESWESPKQLKKKKKARRET
ncbi:protein LYRIC isoform 2-T2 [Gastrophryne carolinensis]